MKVKDAFWHFLWSSLPAFIYYLLMLTHFKDVGGSQELCGHSGSLGGNFCLLVASAWPVSYLIASVLWCWIMTHLTVRRFVIFLSLSALAGILPAMSAFMYLAVSDIEWRFMSASVIGAYYFVSAPFDWGIEASLHALVYIIGFGYIFGIPLVLVTWVPFQALIFFKLAPWWRKKIGYDEAVLAASDTQQAT